MGVMRDAHLSFGTQVGDGVVAIDTGFHRERFDAAYLVVEAGRAAFIDTGTNHAVPRLLTTLAELGLAPEAVDWVVPTHVHLDHAGGCGLLMQHLPKARLLVHPRGARHLVNPGRLWASASAVYGDAEMQRSYGQLQPVDPGRVLLSTDGQVVELAHRPLEVAHTPGHARHHHCLWDERTRGWFTGDTCGLSYREFDNERGAWILPSSTPVQFDPPALQASIDRLMARQPECLYLTHFGRVADCPRLAGLLRTQLAAMVGLARSLPRNALRHEALKRGQLAIFVRSLHEHGCVLDEAQIASVLAMDLELNAQGMAVWLDAAQPRGAATLPAL